MRDLSPESARAFSEWMGKMHGCHPSTALRSASGYLPADIETAAVHAFLALPDAPKYADLLSRYMRSKQETDCHRVPFFRPNKESMFFEQMGDVIGHAVRWGKEYGRKVSAPKPAPLPAATAEGMSHEEVMQAWEEIKKEPAE